MQLRGALVKHSSEAPGTADDVVKAQQMQPTARITVQKMLGGGGRGMP